MRLSVLGWTLNLTTSILTRDRKREDTDVLEGHMKIEAEIGVM